MAHLTKKKLAERERNNKMRSGAYTARLGEIRMGYESNQARKAASHAYAWREY